MRARTYEEERNCEDRDKEQRQRQRQELTERQTEKNRHRETELTETERESALEERNEMPHTVSFHFILSVVTSGFRLPFIFQISLLKYIYHCNLNFLHWLNYFHQT